MSKSVLKNVFSTSNTLFDEIEKFKEFCVDYGYAYNEKFMYDEKHVIGRQFKKFMNNKEPRNNWVEDAKKFAEL